MMAPAGGGFNAAEVKIGEEEVKIE